MATSSKKSEPTEFGAVVRPDEYGNFHLGADINGVFVKFSSISQVHAQALAAKAVVIAGSSGTDYEGNEPDA